MELIRKDFRVMIFYEFKSSLSPQDCTVQIAFGREAPHLNTVRRWYAELNRGRVSFHDEIREDQPLTITMENISTVSGRRFVCRGAAPDRTYLEPFLFFLYYFEHMFGIETTGQSRRAEVDTQDLIGRRSYYSGVRARLIRWHKRDQFPVKPWPQEVGRNEAGGEVSLISLND
ncbi:hypothetical protein EVAR_55675_1 [Eumeta japonica]|uniref:Mos1 transposase HTH domain-containing protein n=1 Tax=Eumeta variegata TaxID=151549 RepID=A0A4C1ZFL6_EUMVA|nr:hypothetical protein EVAR_55675_1 [Eumeta japonica]